MPSFCQMVSITGVPVTVQRNLAALPTKVVMDLGLEKKVGGYASVTVSVAVQLTLPYSLEALQVYSPQSTTWVLRISRVVT